MDDALHAGKLAVRMLSKRQAQTAIAKAFHVKSIPNEGVAIFTSRLVIHHPLTIEINDEERNIMKR